MTYAGMYSVKSCYARTFYKNSESEIPSFFLFFYRVSIFIYFYFVIVYLYLYPIASSSIVSFHCRNAKIEAKLRYVYSLIFIKNDYHYECIVLIEFNRYCL